MQRDNGSRRRLNISQLSSQLVLGASLWGILTFNLLRMWRIAHDFARVLLCITCNVCFIGIIEHSLYNNLLCR